MKIKMLKTCKGSESGLVINEYKEGETYDMQDKRLGQYFIDSKCAELVGGDGTHKSDKALDSSSYDNKAMQPKKGK